MVLSGRSADGSLIEIIELRDHPWFVGTQFHPEFKSRPTRPHPLFRGFVGAAVARAGHAKDAAAARADGLAYKNGHQPPADKVVASSLAGS